jgi:hypothetical protein
VFEQPDRDIMIIGNACLDDLDGPGVGYLLTNAGGDSLGAGIYLRQEFAVMTTWVRSVVELSSGSYLIAGTHHRFESLWRSYRLLLELDADGGVMWMDTQRTDLYASWYAVYGVEDGGFFAVGQTAEGDSLELVKFSAAHNIDWERRYELPNDPSAMEMVLNNRGEYLILTRDDYLGSGNFGYRVDAQGNLLGNWSGSVKHLHRASSGGFIAAHRKSLYRFNDDGWPLWQRDYSLDSTLFDQGIYGLTVLRDGGYLFASEVYAPDELSGTFLIRTLPDTTTITAIDDAPMPLPSDFALTAYPNPFNPQTTLSFTLQQATAVHLNMFDITGRQILEINLGQMSAGPHDVRFDGSNLAAGFYFASWKFGSEHETQKLLLLK